MTHDQCLIYTVNSVCVETTEEAAPAGVGAAGVRPMEALLRPHGGVSAVLAALFFFASFFTGLV